MRVKAGFLVFTLLVLIGYLALKMFGSPSNTNTNLQPKLKSSLIVSSPAFKSGSFIPIKYTCKGQNINPPLEIKNLPPQAKSLALIVEDPDAPMGTWDHWIVYNIPPTTSIAEDSLPPGSKQITNSFGYQKYGGPCPPPGKPHRYFFKVYALDTILPANISTKAELLEAIGPHLLASGQLIGKFGR